MKKHIGLILAVAAITTAALGVAWFGEGNAPHPNDTPTKSLQKINSILYSGGLVVTGTFAASPNVNVTNTPSVNVTNGSLAVNVTNAAVPVVGFTYVSTNYFTNASAAGTANYVAWAVTNSDAFRINGGSGILHSLTIVNNTNRDYNIWIFPLKITAPTVDATWTPSLADIQYAKRLSTTNTTWATAGTNYVLTLTGIGLPLVNRDSSKVVHIIGTYMDTKAGYNTAGYISIGLLQD